MLSVFLKKTQKLFVDFFSVDEKHTRARARRVARCVTALNFGGADCNVDLSVYKR
jgi:hypothetical protein